MGAFLTMHSILMHASRNGLTRKVKDRSTGYWMLAQDPAQS